VALRKITRDFQHFFNKCQSRYQRTVDPLQAYTYQLCLPVACQSQIDARQSDL